MTSRTAVTVAGNELGMVRLIAGLLAGFLLPSLCAADAQRGSLSLEERVAAQRAIEQVYWNHRIWPAENRSAKPPLSAVLSDAAIRARVDDYLRKSSALETYWHRPITSTQLQAEMTRMAAQTRDPHMLYELFEALGNDPFLIAETLVRQTLVDRLIRSWYSGDERFHGALKARVEAALAECRSVECMRSMHGEYRETTLKRRTLGTEKTEKVEGASPRDVVRLDGTEWDRQIEGLAERLGAKEDAVPVLKLSGLEETAEAFAVSAVLSRSKGEIRIATVIWEKSSFDAWWSKERGSLATRAESGSKGFTLPAIVSPDCVVNTWDPVRGADKRSDHTAVWTGTEMIVWGGWYNSLLTTGGRYNPSIDTWVPTSTGANVPAARYDHTAVWTGTEMLVWGGRAGGYLNTGGRYDALTDTWNPLSTGANDPSARAGHVAVWTGAAMIVWGGYDGTALNTGGRYDPSSDTWTPTSTGANVPAARSGHTAVWTGSEMIVWGGGGAGGSLNTGGQYDPSADAWIPTSTDLNVPAAISGHTAVWTGSEMIVWGGCCSPNRTNAGGRYNPSTDAWAPTSMGADVPSPRSGHAAVWTGTQMIIWGGFDGPWFNTGGRYDPTTDTWTPTSTGANAPEARQDHTAVWTGAEMIVWGGNVGGEDFVNAGGRYDPSTDTWIPTSTVPNVPAGRSGHTAAWTGSEMIVWGGRDDVDELRTGGRYVPSIDTWTPTSTGANVPAARTDHTAVWTGAEMVVWGGYDGVADLNSGARYDPTTNAWSPTTTGTNVPSARSGHLAVWTGTKMIIWGGHDAGGSLNTGGRYDPLIDGWTLTSTGANAPVASESCTAVWTGTQMIVWGFHRGRYDPSSDTWSAMSPGANIQAGGAGHTAVWTGTEMIVWGGDSFCYVDYFGNPYCLQVDTGGRYDPSTDAWTPIAPGPQARSGQTAVWTGTEMIVWGGHYDTCFEECCTADCGCWFCYSVTLPTGGRYNPATDSWTPTSGTGVPFERDRHTSVWTGKEMLVWGGLHDSVPTGQLRSLDDGGLYCACPGGALVYRDADGDGYGDAAVVSSSCDGLIPAGYVANQDDCNDTSASIKPGALEICNSVDDDCDSSVDNAAPPGPLASLTMRGDVPMVEWAPVAAAQTYDVVFGDLGQLRSSGGDFTTATQACLASGTAGTSAAFNSTPSVGQGYWILVRGNNCAGIGTYDSGDPGQIGSRDAEIDASPFSCGYQPVCGDGVCNGAEDCSTCSPDCGPC